MRRLIATFLLVTGTLVNLQAEPYSHMDEIATQPKTFLAYRLLTADSIRYCLAVPAEKIWQVTPQEADTLIRAALREWTHGIALRIRQAGRAEEFPDILAVLEKPLTLSNVPGCESLANPTHKWISSSNTKADIVFLVSSKQCERKFKETASFYSPAEKNRLPLICLQAQQNENPLQEISFQEYVPMADTKEGANILQQRFALFDTVAKGGYSTETQQELWETNRFFSYDRPTLFATIAHELGHAFGLRDEYLDERPEDYASKQPGTGIMQRLYDPISCDEVDGMITLLDRLNNTSRTFRSFCSNRNVLENGTEK